MFRRRATPGWAERVRAIFWPRGGWWRATLYTWHRLRRLPDQPHRIARGIACGIFVSFTPFFGFHFVLAALFAWLIGGNVVAALLGTFFGNPLTFPLIAAVSLELGGWMLGVEVSAQQVGIAFGHAMGMLWHNILAVFTPAHADWDGFPEFVRSLFLPYLIGGIAPGLACALAGHYLALPVIAAYQKRRRNRIHRRWAELRRRAHKRLEAATEAAAEEAAQADGPAASAVPARQSRESKA